MAATVCWEIPAVHLSRHWKGAHCPCHSSELCHKTRAIIIDLLPERLTTNWVVGAAPGEPPGASSGSHLCWPSPALEVEKANKDVIQKMRQEALQAQHRQPSSSSAAQTSGSGEEGRLLLPLFCDKVRWSDMGSGLPSNDG
jgi:hypothetical protein